MKDVRKKNKTFKPKEKSEFDTKKIEEENIYEKPIKRIYIRKKFDKDLFSNGSKRDSEFSSKNGEEKSEYSSKDGYIYQKKKLSSSRFDDIKNEQEEEKYNEFKIKNNIFIQNDNLISKLSRNFKEGLPTKIKVYKCVFWKNSDYNVNEESIKNFLHKSCSNFFNKGGFVMKLPKNKSFKAKHENI